MASKLDRIGYAFKKTLIVIRHKSRNFERCRRDSAQTYARICGGSVQSETILFAVAYRGSDVCDVCHEMRERKLPR